MTVLRIDRLEKHWGRGGVGPIDLSIGEPGLWALVGPNGAGKSTLLRCIAGVLVPDAGRIEVAGHDLVHAGIRARRHLGYCPQQLELPEFLTPRELVRLAGELRGVGAEDLGKATGAWFDGFALGPFADHMLAQCSEGTKRKAALVAALCGFPRLVLLDEALAGLDPPAARFARHLFELARAAGSVIVWSTHVLALAERIADFVLFLDDGRLAACWTRAQLDAELKSGRTLDDLWFAQERRPRP